MKHILIVTYYFPPYNIIASRRPYHWATYLSQFYKVTVLTRSWTGTEDGMRDIAIENLASSTQQVNENLTVINIPYKKPAKKTESSGLINKVKLRYRHLFGDFLDIEFVRENFEAQILSTIKNINPSLIVYTCNPYQFLPIAQNVYNATGINYIIDFRDLYNWSVLRKQPTFKQWLYKKIILHRTKKWLTTATTVTTVSPPIQNILKSIFKKEVQVIYNGFDEEQCESLQNIIQDNVVFTTSYIGNINSELNTTYFTKGLQLFFNDCNPNAVVNFIGVSKSQQQALEPTLHQVKYNFLGWMPHEQALQYAKQSSLLVYMGWNEYKGILSGKIFDYLGVQRTILLAPGDEGVIEDLLSKTNSGIIANSAEEVYDALKKCYLQWKNNGQVEYNGKLNEIANYSRQQQSIKLKQLIDNILQ
jgi:glycosyltransferase involved in cell wall biosynthesis